jgi:sulfur carrier protein ThiS
MRINIAILNQNLRTVEVAEGATVLQALQAAELDANRVSEIKRNATVISQGTVLNDGDTILVVQGKIQGGNDVDT